LRREKQLPAPIEKPEMLLKIAELCVEHDGWSVGTSGTIVEAFEDGALFEIADADGCTLALLPVPYGALVIEDSPRGSPGAHPAC
jgi:hypothetical protein